jgi:hypothetical protein
MKTLKTFLISIMSALLLFTGYVYFSDVVKSEANAYPLSSSLVTGVTNPNNSSLNQIAQDTAFLNTLTSLTRIKIDTTLFSDPGFTALKANEIIIEPVTPGRENPFAVITTGTVSSNNDSPKVVTTPVSSLTNTTAVLNGTLTDPASSTNNYFEYGTDTTLVAKTLTLGAMTTLVGTFNTKIVKLTPKTTYYFRSASKINGTVVYGEIVSFTTN